MIADPSQDSDESRRNRDRILALLDERERIGLGLKLRQRLKEAATSLRDSGSADGFEVRVPAADEWVIYFGSEPGCFGFIGKVLRVRQLGDGVQAEVEWEMPEALDIQWEDPAELAVEGPEMRELREAVPQDVRRQTIECSCSHVFGF
mmetsp:Transcript_42174/g.66044  ORF Transcript_42174/g.66044 Transcript_42174/m.66044 type:complete len:148 (-) Transcript_42174:113-556(-)